MNTIIAIAKATTTTTIIKAMRRSKNRSMIIRTAKVTGISMRIRIMNKNINNIIKIIMSINAVAITTIKLPSNKSLPFKRTNFLPSKLTAINKKKVKKIRRTKLEIKTKVETF